MVVRAGGLGGFLVKNILAHFLKELEAPRCFDELLPALAGLGFRFTRATVFSGGLEWEAERR